MQGKKLKPFFYCDFPCDASAAAGCCKGFYIVQKQKTPLKYRFYGVQTAFDVYDRKNPARVSLSVMPSRKSFNSFHRLMVVSDTSASLSFVISGFKTHDELEQVSQLLTDKNGNIFR